MDSPDRSHTLAETDIRAIVGLLGEVIAAPRDFNRQRRLVMDGICRIVTADAWLWCMANYEPDAQLGHSRILHGGFDDARFSRFLEAINHPAMEAVSRLSAIELQQRGTHITRTLDQLEDPDARLMDSPAGPLWRKADIGTLMLSLRPMPEGGATGVGLYRRTGAPHFNDRESRIVHIILSEIPWLHYQEFNAKDDILRLYPRHRTVLNLLCEGWSRKKIADHLGIGINTVHGYVKDVYKHFNVHTQAELLTRFSLGDGGDR